MNRRLEQKVKMYLIVQNTVAQYQTVWENVPKLAEAIQEFNSKLEILRQCDENRRIYTLGVRKQRDFVKDDTISMIDEVASALRSLALDLVDLELAAQVTISKSRMKTSSHISLLGVFDRIVQLADFHSESLEAYGINAEKIAEFHLRRDTLSIEILAPKKAILKRKNEGIYLMTLNKEIEELLKIKIDGMIKSFRRTNPEFYTAYQNARKVTTVVYHNSSNDVEPPEVDDGNID